MTNINARVLNGRNGFIIEGTNQDGRLGDAVSNAGDINGDGLVDILVGARDANNERGQIAVIFGTTEGFINDSEDSTELAGRFPISQLNGTNGFRVGGIRDQQFFGISVSSAGDVNNDGIDDFIVGANKTDNSNTVAYVVFGNQNLGSESIDLAALDGTNGFQVNDLSEEDFLDTAVTDAGDLNGDGIADIAVTGKFVDANGNTNAGATYVIFGRDGGFSGNLNLANLNGDNGFVVNGADSGDLSGTSVSSAGDLNGDGTDDLVIGAPFASPGDRDSAGKTYVVFGQTDGFDAAVDLANLEANGLTIEGVAAGNGSGGSVSSVGDINGDGFDDIGIGAYLADANNTNAGRGFIVFGRENGFGQNSLSLSTLDGSNGFIVDGVGVDDRLGTAISPAGDVNNDGLDDLIISAVGVGNEAGASYVIFGQDESVDGVLDLADLNINRGFAINGLVETDRSGESVSEIGDLNNDGIDDLLIGAPQGSPGGLRDAGEAYVMFGRIELLGDANNDRAYTTEDAYLISRMAVGLDATFPNHPELDPLLVADVNSDGVISALDSAIVYSVANGGTSNFILPDIE